MSKWIEGVLKYSETEFKLLGLHHIGLDVTITKFIRELHAKLGNQPGAMKTIANTHRTRKTRECRRWSLVIVDEDTIGSRDIEGSVDTLNVWDFQSANPQRGILNI